MPDEESVEFGIEGFGGRSRIAYELYGHSLVSDKFRPVVDDPSYALAQDPLAWEKINRDAIFSFLIQTRRRLVASTAFVFEGASDLEEDVLLASVLDQAFKRIPRFWMGRFNLTDADFRGSAYARMTFDQKLWGPVMGSKAELKRADREEWHLPQKLVDVDRYRFRLANEKGERIWQFRSIVRDRWEPLINPEFFIRHVYEDSERSRQYGVGILDSLYFIHYAKVVLFEIGLQGVEAWANGRLEVAIDGLRDASTGKTNVEIAASWKAAIRAWARDRTLVRDKTDEVKMHDGPTQGHNMAVDFLQYCDSAASRLILGAELPFGGNQGGGSLARAIEEGDRSDAYVQPSRDLLAETLSDSLVPTYIRVNKAQLERLGLGKAEPPRLRLRAEPVNDPEKAARVAQILHSAGFDLVKAPIYEKTELPEPGPNDDVLAGLDQTGGVGGAGVAGGLPPFASSREIQANDRRVLRALARAGDAQRDAERVRVMQRG